MLVGDRYRIISVSSQFVVRVLRIETAHVLVEIEGHATESGDPIRRWWSLGWFTLRNTIITMEPRRE